MTTFTMMALPLSELERAIDSGDVPGICRAMARVISPMGSIYATPQRTGPHGLTRVDPGRGDRLIEVERCIDKLGAMATASGLGGVVWDQGWAIAALQYLSALLRGRPVLEPAPPA